MHKEKNTLSAQFAFTLSPPEDNQAALLAAIEQFGLINALSAAQRYRLGLIIDELVTNSIVHGGCKGIDQTIKVRIASYANELIIEVIDTGCPFDPTAQPLTHPCLEGVPPVGGAGLCLVRQLADRIHYTRSNDHNHLVISLNKVPEEKACTWLK